MPSMRTYALLGVVVVFAEGSFARATCNGTFEPISAASFVALLHPGWNPGNTMDAPHETDWGNPPLVESTFANVKSLGFKGIRLPVTWTYHMMDEAPWTVDADWIQRVSDVIDMITSNGLYVLVNAHHDSWASFDLTTPNANYTRYEQKFYSLWHQIGEKLACKSNMVAFEPLNEPTGSTVEHAAELNKLQRLFLEAIHASGGFNTQRVVVLGGLGDNAVNMVQWLELPASNLTNPYALTFHYYSPWDFTAAAWGKTIWGTDADKAAVESDFAAVRGNFTDIPIIVGEFGLEIHATEPAARWKWFDHVVRTGHKYNFAMMLWDASIHFVVNSTDPWQDPTALDILLNAAGDGPPNQLPDSTEDANAGEQWSSAFMFHRVGEPVTDISLPFLWAPVEEPQILESIVSTTAEGSTTLWHTPNLDKEGNNMTFRTGYLDTIFAVNGTPGVKAELLWHFSGGADLITQAVQWDTPQPVGYATDFTVTPANVGYDLYVPIEYKGLAKLAAVKAVMVNSTYLFDSWTQWLGPLQQARLTYSSHWDYNATHVIIKSAVLKAVLDANFATALTFEFYPRVHANTVNFTLNVVQP